MEKEKTKIIDIIKHPGFLESVRNQLREINQQRANVTLRGVGLKRSAIETLEEFKVVPESYPALYLEILLKKSRLSSRERNFVKSIGYKALIETYNKYFTKK
jgi:ribosomal protein S8